MSFDGTTTDPIQMAVRDVGIGFGAAGRQSLAEAYSRLKRLVSLQQRQTARNTMGANPTMTDKHIKPYVR